ncbi:hypothetical protein [Marinicella rhabdoformis]|uniref:hypothetical protein n=1 Tax=Marinicella rhabdoformis TaxID=2580566 RepID=UPI0012AECA52|nr:hypothetical protein [Marinicella rhabdoformis]
MKLTEQQLQELFQSSSMNTQSAVSAGDCLSSAEASSQRLQKAEALLNDFTAAQAMKAAFSTKSWSEQIAQSVTNQSVSSWFNWLSNPFKTTLTASAFALAVVVALPNLSSNQQQMMPIQQAQVDVISAAPFESDVLSNSSFDSSANAGKDSLFNGSFG